MITSLDDFKAYKVAMVLSENVWGAVSAWGIFDKDAIGKQLVRSCDSVAANLSEGLGRYHYKEAKNFSYYPWGSLFETRTWLTKAHSRNLITKEQFDKVLVDIEQVGRMINGYSNSIGTAKQPLEPYGNNSIPDAQSPMPNP